ncbi:DUF982 domain-containing protein [Labrys neptuniae]
MTTHPWSEPLRFETGTGEVLVIATAEEASRFLSSHRELDTGEKFIAAQRACLDAVIGFGRLESAREAFLEVCEEAHMQLLH